VTHLRSSAPPTHLPSSAHPFIRSLEVFHVA
jgi:hypothetical protein